MTRSCGPRSPARQARRGPLLSRTDLYSQNDDKAACVVAAGGGIQAVIEATDLRTRENALRLLEPDRIWQGPF